jgi:hypothetical protein
MGKEKYFLCASFNKYLHRKLQKHILQRIAFFNSCNASSVLCSINRLNFVTSVSYPSYRFAPSLGQWRWNGLPPKTLDLNVFE